MRTGCTWERNFADKTALSEGYIVSKDISKHLFHFSDVFHILQVECSIFLVITYACFHQIKESLFTNEGELETFSCYDLHNLPLFSSLLIVPYLLFILEAISWTSGLFHKHYIGLALFGDVFRDLIL